MQQLLKWGALWLTLMGFLLLACGAEAAMSNACEMQPMQASQEVEHMQVAQASGESSGMAGQQHTMSAPESATTSPQESSSSGSQKGMGHMGQMMGKGMMGSGMMGGKMMGGQQGHGGMGGMGGMMGGKHQGASGMTGGEMGHMMGSGMGMGKGHSMGMMAPNSPSPIASLAAVRQQDFFLSLKDELGLTSEQLNDLKGIALAFKKELIRKNADKALAELDLDDLLDKKDADLLKVQAKVSEIAKLDGELRFNFIEKAVKAKALLNDKQRQALEHMTSSREQGMKCCEMMGREHAGVSMTGGMKSAQQAGSDTTGESTEHKEHKDHKSQ